MSEQARKNIEGSMAALNEASLNDAPQMADGSEGVSAPAASANSRAARKARKDDPTRLGRDSIGKLLVEFSIPGVISMVFSSLYNLIDTAFLGQALPDGSGVAVTTLALPVMTILIACSMIAGQGGNSLAAIQLGQGDREEVERTLGNSAVLLFAISAVIAVMAIVFIGPVLTIIGTPDILWDKTKVFVQISCIFFAFQSVGWGLSHFIRTAGRPVFSLMTSVIGTIMCIIFNYWFVLVLDWGVAGSAWANICGQAIGMVPVIWFFTANKNTPFKLRWRCCKPNLRLMLKILTLGLAPFCMQVASTVVNIVFNQVAGYYGALSPIGVQGALASLGVAQKVSWFAFSPFIGLTMGAQPLFGFNYGASNWNRVLRTYKITVITAVIMGAFWLLITRLFSNPIVVLFGVTGELEEFSNIALLIYTVMFPLVGFQAVGSNYFQASGQPLKSAILVLTRQVIFLIPFYFIIPNLAIELFGVDGLYGVAACVPAADLCSVIVTAVFVVIELRKLFRWRKEGYILPKIMQSSGSKQEKAQS
ncbi:MAG: MATE family efflux transporter [Eggerthellaceae bacterium]|nr:MATE family efflux transporter [Eggerthellaceae bacterium]